MVSMNPSPIISTHQSAAFRKEGTPFSKAIVSLTKQEYIQLKWDGRYWKRQHDRAAARADIFKQELELARRRESATLSSGSTANGARRAPRHRRHSRAG